MSRAIVSRNCLHWKWKWIYNNILYIKYNEHTQIAPCTVCAPYCFFFPDTVQHSQNHGRNQVREAPTVLVQTNVPVCIQTAFFFFFHWFDRTFFTSQSQHSDNSIWSANDFRLFGFVILFYHFQNGRNGKIHLICSLFGILLSIVCIPSMFRIYTILFRFNNGQFNQNKKSNQTKNAERIENIFAKLTFSR